MEAINRSNAIIYFDLNGFILGVNTLFLKAMGLADNEHDKLIGKHHSIFVSYEYSKSDDYIKFWETLREGKYYEGEFERRKIDGSPIFLQATYNPILDESGAITKIMKIATDITETIVSKNKIEELSSKVKAELENSNKLRAAIEIEKDAAVNDLDATIKKMYSFAILSNKDTQIIGSTWSNMFSVLLTNAFSIVGTIMGIKYATSEDKKSKNEN
jgi:PAS domain S-box-containing protein